MDPSSPPAKLAYATYLDAIAANVSRLTNVLSEMPQHARVPSCPDWSAGELAAHAGDFAAFYTHAICDSTGATRPPWPNTWRAGAGSPLNGESPAVYFEDRATFLLALLGATASDAEVRTWNKDDQTAHFVARRSAHELAVHRVDAEIAAGGLEPIDAVVAVDGIEEIFVMLEVFGNRFRGRARSGGSGTLHIHAADAPRDWVVIMSEDRVEVRREPVAASLTVTGTASDLELLLYGRPTVGTVDRTGDAAVLDAWYQAFTF